MKPEARNQLVRLSVVVIAMFGFGFAFVPVYRVFCEITGVNLQADDMKLAANDAPAAVDESRWVNVQFLTTVNGGADWGFKPAVSSVRVHPGAMTTVSFTAHNPAATPMVAQAVPSIAPIEASSLLRKTECFCFKQQEFAPGETREMPVRFVIDPSLPADVDTVTLSYTFFDVTNVARRAADAPKS